MGTRPTSTDSLEIKLAFQIIACRTCDFFWPKNGSAQPYGPYSAFDFDQDFAPPPAPVMGAGTSFSWAQGITAEPAFPTPEIMDGCRKAPIMTIGINPNLTSFFPGPTGASWCYPGFTSDNGSDASAKYAYYYRYRSLYQEHFDANPQFITPYLLPDGHIIAADDGKMGLIKVTGVAPPIELTLDYKGQAASVINLNWTPGQPPYVVLVSSGTKFKKGDLLAAKLSVPAGKPVNIDRQLVTYYNQFVPVIDYFNNFLESNGNAEPNVRMCEDVCQLDMVACASPHWAPPFMGGKKTENEVISNCLSTNAWVIKQLVQTKPAVIYIIGETSYAMFRDNFGKLIKSNNPLNASKADGAFTLLRQTTDLENPVTLEYSYNNNGQTYNLSSRLVISPHFSFFKYFVPQFRFSPKDLKTLKTKYPDCYQYLGHNPDMSLGLKDPAQTYTAFQINSNVQQVLATLRSDYDTAYTFLMANYYDVHLMLSTVLDDLYSKGNLLWVTGTDGNPGYLTRNEGSCNFCVNNYWTFPQGCPYKKDSETHPPPGFLEMIAADMAVKGKPVAMHIERFYAEKMPIAPDGKILI